MAFEQHVEAMGRLIGAVPPVPDVWYRQPLFYFSNPAAVIGPYDDVPVPPGCEIFDFELEVAAVIGPVAGVRELADLTVPEAAQAITGYLLMNDWPGQGPAGGGDVRPAGPVQGQGLRDHARAVAGHR